MTSWHSYPSIYNLGHAAVKDLFSADVIVQEKIDGSQFSFGLIDGVLRIRSKGQEMNPAAPEKMFAKATATVLELQSRGALLDGWTYRGEVLDKPKHNVLAYDRVPVGNVILFDINKGEEDYLDPDTATKVTETIGLEFVRTFHNPAEGWTLPILKNLLDTPSALGGQKIEGVVVKSTTMYGPDKKRLMGKYVSEAFKEQHSETWKSQTGAKATVMEQIIGKYKTSARWAKAVIHLRERGLIEDSPRDIPALMREVTDDLFKEEGVAIAATLLEFYRRDIGKQIANGLPEWWKAELLKKQFEGTETFGGS